MITSFFLNIWLDYRLALEVEEIFDLLSHGGHDGGIEESVQTAEQESTDHDGDQNLDAGIDVTFGTDVVDGTLSTDGEHVALFGNLVKKLFHSKYLVLSFDFDLDFVVWFGLVHAERKIVVADALSMGIVGSRNSFEELRTGVAVKGMHDIAVLDVTLRVLPLVRWHRHEVAVLTFDELDTVDGKSIVESHVADGFHIAGVEGLYNLCIDFHWRVPPFLGDIY